MAFISKETDQKSPSSEDDHMYISVIFWDIWL